MALNKLTSLDKSGSSSTTETEDTVTVYTKKISISSASSDDKNIKEQQPTEIRFRFCFNKCQSKCFKYICTCSKYNDCITGRRTYP